MRYGQDEALFRRVIRQGYDTAPSLQESEHLQMPAARHLHNVAESVSGGGQFFNSIIVFASGKVGIRFLFHNFDRQINVTHSFDLWLQHAAKKNDSGYLAQEIWFTIDPFHSATKFLQ